MSAAAAAPTAAGRGTARGAIASWRASIATAHWFQRIWHPLSEAMHAGFDRLEDRQGATGGKGLPTVGAANLTSALGHSQPRGHARNAGNGGNGGQERSASAWLGQTGEIPVRDIAVPHDPEMLDDGDRPIADTEMTMPLAPVPAESPTRSALTPAPVKPTTKGARRPESQPVVTSRAAGGNDAGQSGVTESGTDPVETGVRHTGAPAAPAAKPKGPRRDRFDVAAIIGSRGRGKAKKEPSVAAVDPSDETVMIEPVKARVQQKKVAAKAEVKATPKAEARVPEAKPAGSAVSAGAKTPEPVDPSDETVMIQPVREPVATAQPEKAQPQKARPQKVEPQRAQQRTVEAEKIESPKARPQKAQPGQAGPQRVAEAPVLSDETVMMAPIKDEVAGSATPVTKVADEVPVLSDETVMMAPIKDEVVGAPVPSPAKASSPAVGEAAPAKASSPAVGKAAPAKAPSPAAGKAAPPKASSPTAGKITPAKAEVLKVAPAEVVSAETEPAKTEPAKTEPGKTAPSTTEAAKNASAKTVPSTTEAVQGSPVRSEAPVLSDETVTMAPIKDEVPVAGKPTAGSSVADRGVTAGSASTRSASSAGKPTVAPAKDEVAEPKTGVPVEKADRADRADRTASAEAMPAPSDKTAVMAPVEEASSRTAGPETSAQKVADKAAAARVAASAGADETAVFAPVREPVLRAGKKAPAQPTPSAAATEVMKPVGQEPAAETEVMRPVHEKPVAAETEVISPVREVTAADATEVMRPVPEPGPVGETPVAEQQTAVMAPVRGGKEAASDEAAADETAVMDPIDATMTGPQSTGNARNNNRSRGKKARGGGKVRHGR
ncbi:hypothetical protein [Kineosporia sp. NBRC 101731]|uniref:hypothetical protein n=1 Tax=Kineosporia sp. NBRC 101731 TaxID=3032199 RepID=UPI002552C951|nr:hypothetical protein [Kineosporia sp. NBRC 101731]